MMSDQWLKDSLVHGIVIERYVYNGISNEITLQHFLDMKTQREQV